MANETSKDEAVNGMGRQNIARDRREHSRRLIDPEKCCTVHDGEQGGIPCEIVGLVEDQTHGSHAARYHRDAGSTPR